MSYSYRPRFGFGSMLTPMVKSLLIINVIVFLLEYITGGTEMIYLLGLVPRFVLRRFFIWQFFTYMFLHGGFWHLFLNMFILWMFGSEIERYWGSREFLKYYFITGVGAGFLSWLTAMNSPVPTIGASGAIYGILVAYGMMFPNRPVYLLSSAREGQTLRHLPRYYGALCLSCTRIERHSPLRPPGRDAVRLSVPETGTLLLSFRGHPSRIKIQERSPKTLEGAGGTGDGAEGGRDLAEDLP